MQLPPSPPLTACPGSGQWVAAAAPRGIAALSLAVPSQGTYWCTWYSICARPPRTAPTWVAS